MMAHTNDQQHLLEFIREKDIRTVSIRVAYGDIACQLYLGRPAKFPGSLTIRAVVRVSDLPSYSAEWFEAYATLLARKTCEYAFEQGSHHRYVFYISRIGSFVESDYSEEELLTAVVTFAVELLFYLNDLLKDSFLWQRQFGSEKIPTPETVYEWRGGRDGLYALRERKGRTS